MFKDSSDFKNKKIAVLGFGIEGKSAVDFLLKNKAEITVFDRKSEQEFIVEDIKHYSQKGVKFIFGDFPDEFNDFDIVVRSPGVNYLQLKEKISKKTILTSPIKIFFDLCPCKIIGVTGTKGKGTTSSLICEMLKKQSYDAYLGGNIGNPPLDFLDQLKADSRVVLELSSFQLMDLDKSPNIAVILMMTSEHLDYHKDVYEYIEAKRNILKFQGHGDSAVIMRDYSASLESDIYTQGEVYQVSRELEVREGCYIENNKVIFKYQISNIKYQKEIIIDTKDILLPGKHNLENVCAAVMAAKLAGVKTKNIVEVLKSFKGLEHRLELVRTVNGVKYYDDSFSTTPETAQAAILAFSDPEILILGGSSKNSDFSRLGVVIREAENIKAIIGIGVEWERIKKEFSIFNFQFSIIEDCKNMREIVQAASKIAGPGDVVILTPACASFDMFKNYKDRGNQFKEEVMRLNKD